MRPKIRPLSLYRGSYVVLSSSGGTKSVGALYNNSAGAELLVVRNWMASQSAIDSVNWLYVVQGTVGSLQSSGIGVETGAAARPGQIWGGTVSTIPTGDWAFVSGTNVQPQWNNPYPFAIIRPGWSLVIALQLVNANSATFSFYWQVCTPAELDYYDEIILPG